jgi:imidazolonepropionase-like amidohydrolase
MLRSFHLFALLLGAASALNAQAPPVTVIKAGALLDPVSGKLSTNATIVVRDENIAEVNPAQLPAGAKVIDLSRYTVLPGLIDCHTHLLLQPEDERGPPPVITKSQAFRTVQGVAAAKKDLEAGFTTMRDVDSEGAGFADVAIRDAINKGIIPGPRMLVSTLAITITGGHMNNAGLNPDIPIPEPAALADSRDALVAEVRRQVKYGADWIKLYATGTLRHVDPSNLDPLSQVSLEDVRAVVDEARRWHRDVASHAYGGEGAKNAIRGGVRSIEHGMFLDDEALQLMLKNGTYWVPTLSVYSPATLEDDSDLQRRVVARHKETFQKAMKMGVRIAFGTDVGAFEHGTSEREFERMVSYGMLPLNAIRAATTTASELLRMERRIGTLEHGKFADVIAVKGNPLEDITALRNVAFVMKAGKVEKAP